LNDELNSIGTGSTYTAISVDEVENVKIPFFQLPEQLSIARFLDDRETCDPWDKTYGTVYPGIISAWRFYGGNP
jgi:hypothetical protein